MIKQRCYYFDCCTAHSPLKVNLIPIPVVQRCVKLLKKSAVT